MFKHKAIIFVLSAVVLGSGLACGQPTETITGKVIKMDVEGGIVYVSTSDGTEAFYVMTESALYMTAHHMSSIEIGKGDPVTIDYVQSAGKNNIIRLVDTKPNA